jgi:predicted acetyltransferase
LEIQLLTADDVLEVRRIWDHAFHHGARRTVRIEDWHDRLQTGDYLCGVRDEGGLQCVMLINGFRVHFGADTVYDMGGVGGVSSLPASRGKGYAGHCLKFALEQMKERGQPVSSLFPFSWNFYRQYGYEWIGTKRDYKVKTSSLPNSKETEWVRAATAQDTPGIVGCYTHYAHRYRGLLKRKEDRWNELLNDTDGHFTFTFVYERDGKIEGYLSYRGGEEKETGLREFVCTSLRAYRGLLGLLRRHEMQTDAFTWSAPDDDPLWNIYYHWDIETKAEPITQARIVDVATAFADWRPATQERGSAVFALTDETCDWNTGTWRVEFEGGRVAIKRVQETPQLSMDIQALSQAFYGAPNLLALRHAERVTVQDERGLTALHTLLDGPLPFTNDGF